MALKWFGQQVRRAVHKKNEKRMYRAAAYVVGFAKTKMSEVGAVLPTRGRKERRSASMPGEYPHKQTGHLRRNVFHEIAQDGKSAFWGTNVLYGKFLEVDLDRKWMTMTNRDPVVNHVLRKILGGKL